MDADLGETPKDFGERLDIAIRQRGLSIAELARESLLSRWTIMNWLHQKTRPEMAGLRRLSRVLGVNAEDLLGREAGEGDGIIDSVEKFFQWKSQQQYQELVVLRRVIDTETQRILAEGMVKRGRPSKAETDQAAAEVVRQVSKPRARTRRTES